MSKIPEYVKNVLSRLEKAGYEAWCVGGCVRDLHLGRVPGDWDVTTSALPEETMRLFGDCALPTGLKHGTVTVKSAGRPIEVTTYRKDGDYLDHRRPESVSFTTSLEEDLLRRDFTVNAMAMDLREQVRDPYGGLVDLKAGLLRCVGDAEQRFEEDALRILRGLRFSACLGFAVQPETAAAIHKKKDLLRQIAVERIWAELVKLLTGGDAVRILREYVDVLGVFWPELLEMVVQQVAWHDRYIPRTDRGLRRALRDLGEPALRRLLAVKRADNLAQAPECHGIQREIDKAEQIMERLLTEGACISLKQLAVSGRDLMALGINGPAVGAGLDLLLEAVIDEQVENNKEALLAYYQAH